MLVYTKSCNPLLLYFSARIEEILIKKILKRDLNKHKTPGLCDARTHTVTFFTTFYIIHIVNIQWFVFSYEVIKIGTFI